MIRTLTGAFQRQAEVAPAGRATVAPIGHRADILQRSLGNQAVQELHETGALPLGTRSAATFGAPAPPIKTGPVGNAPERQAEPGVGAAARDPYPAHSRGDTTRPPVPTPQAAAMVGGARDFGRTPRFPPRRMDGFQPPSPFQALRLPGPLQAKLEIGAINDRLEHEADRVAEQVVRMPAAGIALTSGPPRISRKCTACEEEKEPLSIAAGPSRLDRQCTVCDDEQASGPADTAPASVDRVLSGSGRPLDSALRQDMEQRFAHDFSQVRVHSGAAAEQSARDVNARAYAVGHDIVFGATEFAPATQEGRRLIAHELTHVVQQSSGDGNSQFKVQCSPDDPVPAIKSKQLPQTSSNKVPFMISFDRPLTRAQFIELAEMTIYGRRIPGEWTGIPDRFKASDSPIEVWIPASTLEAGLRTSIAALRPDIRKFLTTDKGPAGSYADLDSVMKAGQILELSDVTEEELLLLEYRQAEAESLGRPPAKTADPVEWATELVIERQAAAEGALKNRRSLTEAIARLESLPKADKDIIRAVKEGVFGFDTIDNVLIYHDNLRSAPLIAEFELELRSITNAFLAQSQVALLRIEKTYLADRNVGQEEEALRQVIEKIRPAVTQRDKAAREAEIQEVRSAVTFGALRAAITGAPDTDLSRARENLGTADEELQKQSKAAGLEVASWKKFDLDVIRGADIETSRDNLRQFVYASRSTLRSAERKAQDVKTLYKADRMLALTKAAVGIKEGSPMDDIVSARAKQATSDGGFWNTVWDVVTFALMFVPGNIGIALRVGAGAINAADAMDKLAEGTLLNQAGLASESPSSLGVVLAVGGTLIDAQQMAKGIIKVVGTEAGAGAKVGSQASSAESTFVHEGEGTAVKAGDDVAERQAGKELKTGSGTKVTDEPPLAPEARKSAAEITEQETEITQDAADRLAKTTYSGGGHDFKVLRDGRVVRCSPLCGDADEMLIMEYEDVLRANPHLLPELDHLTSLIASDPDQAAKLAADLEARLARIRGSAFETGPGRAVGRAEDVGGRLHETTRYRAGIAGNEGRAAREELRRNLGRPPGGAGEYQAHHIVPFELRNHPFVDKMRVRFNWNINGRENGIWLPTQEGLLSAGGATVHRGSHARYTLWVESRVDDLAARYAAGAIPDGRILREFEDIIGEFENVARASYFGVRQPSGAVILR